MSDGLEPRVSYMVCVSAADVMRAEGGGCAAHLGPPAVPDGRSSTLFFFHR